MRAMIAGLLLLLCTVAMVLLPPPAVAQHFNHSVSNGGPVRNATPGLPSDVDPRFGIISFQPTFATREPINPAFLPQPFPPLQVIIVPDSALFFVPGQWWWSGWSWVWVPPRWSQ